MEFIVATTPKFENDLEEILLYIGRGNIEAATRFALSVETTIELLATQPFAGFVRTFHNEMIGPVRFRPVKGFDRYLIAYQPGSRVGDSPSNTTLEFVSRCPGHIC